MTLRKFAYDRLPQALSHREAPYSVYAQLLWDLDFFLSAIIDLLTDAMQADGVINKLHPG